MQANTKSKSVVKSKQILWKVLNYTGRGEYFNLLCRDLNELEQVTQIISLGSFCFLVCYWGYKVNKKE